MLNHILFQLFALSLKKTDSFFVVITCYLFNSFYLCKNKRSMSTDEMKIQIFRQIDALDAGKLKEFYGVMLNYLSSKNDINEWVGVSKAEQKGIEAAIKELNTGKGLVHQDVMNRFKKKSTHDSQR